MKQFLTALTLLLCLYSCENNESYKYELYEVPNDTSLYISYDKNNIHYKYFQIKEDWSSFYNPLQYNSTQDLYYYRRDISFDRLITDSEYFNVLHPAIGFTFWNIYLHNKNSERDFIYYYNTTNLFSELKQNFEYKYVYPPEKPELKDSIFMRGVSISNYTEYTLKHFNYDNNLMQNYLSQKSYFKISDIKLVNNGYYLIKGSFSTRAIYLSDTINLENGKFAFITK